MDHAYYFDSYVFMLPAKNDLRDPSGGLGLEHVTRN